VKENKSFHSLHGLDFTHCCSGSYNSSPSIIWNLFLPATHKLWNQLLNNHQFFPRYWIYTYDI